jgi:hypothetical protein
MKTVSISRLHSGTATCYGRRVCDDGIIRMVWIETHLVNGAVWYMYIIADGETKLSNFIGYKTALTALRHAVSGGIGEVLYK